MQCAGCQKPILDQYALQVIGRYFHDDCLKCACCNGPLADLSRICYYRDFLLLCTRDYMRLYGKQGQCSGCLGEISPLDYVLRAKKNVYHLDCFACTNCNGRFCVGDNFYMHGVQIFCPNHYFQKLKIATTRQQL
ncbi:LIM domain only protein 3-like isoform X3 [Aphelenchoides bicaudatus]|nr:LIM domain only protein 3-like isoform X3 [Aphelenchoides bicaudatus]